MIPSTDGDEFSTEFVAFWQERHLLTLTTLRPDGSPHVVPVGATFEPERSLFRVICSAGSRKAANVAASPGPAVAVLCQVDGGRWSSVEGFARVTADRSSVAEAERRYALRYRTPRPNPERVVIEIALSRRLGLR